MSIYTTRQISHDEAREAMRRFENLFWRLHPTAGGAGLMGRFLREQRRIADLALDEARRLEIEGGSEETVATLLKIAQRAAAVATTVVDSWARCEL